MYGRFMYGRSLYAQPSILTFGTAFTKALTESLTLVDSVLRFTIKPFIEIKSFTEILTRAATLSRTITDAVQLIDTIQLPHTIAKALTDTLMLVEALAKKATKALIEVLVDVESYVWQSAKPLSESLTINELFNTVATNIRNPFDSLTITENLTKGITKEVDDAPTFLETLLVGVAYLRSLADDFSLSDTIATAHAIANQALTDTLVLVDSTAHAMTRSMNDLFKLIVDYHAVHPGWGKIGKTIATWIKQRKPE